MCSTNSWTSNLPKMLLWLLRGKALTHNSPVALSLIHFLQNDRLVGSQFVSERERIPLFCLRWTRRDRIRTQVCSCVVESDWCDEGWSHRVLCSRRDRHGFVCRTSLVAEYHHALQVRLYPSTHGSNNGLDIVALSREAFSVLKEAGCSDEALCYEMWMSKEPAEIFERAAEDGFIAQVWLLLPWGIRY